jgi:hypothetical protein
MAMIPDPGNEAADTGLPARKQNPTQLGLGPVLYNWAPERWRDFYFRVADEAPS